MTDSNDNTDTDTETDEQPDTHVETTVGDTMSEETRERAAEAEANSPSPVRRAALADIDPDDVTARMIDHDVRFSHYTDEMRRETKELRGLPTAPTEPPSKAEVDETGIMLDEAEVERRYGDEQATDAERGEPLRKGDVGVLMDAAQGAESTDVTESDSAANESPGQSSSDATTSGSDNTPPAQSLADTGMLNEDEQFPWESEDHRTTGSGDRKQVEFPFKGMTFELTEPESGAATRRIEDARDEFQGAQMQSAQGRDTGDARFWSERMEYFETLADSVLTFEGRPLGEWYLVKRDGREHDNYVLSEEEAREYDLIGPNATAEEVAADGGTSKAEQLGVEVAPYWQGCLDVDRVTLGRRTHQFCAGLDNFQ